MFISLSIIILYVVNKRRKIIVSDINYYRKRQQIIIIPAIATLKAAVAAKPMRTREGENRGRRNPAGKW